jgi:hypothetical protein
MTIQEQNVKERLENIEFHLKEIARRLYLIQKRIDQLGKYGQFDPTEAPDDHEH